MKAYKETIRTYYKWSYSSFSQPVLSANGDLGGDSFAVLASSEYAAADAAWKAFDDTASTFWCATTQTLNNQYLIMYYPNELNVTTISVKNRAYNNVAVTGGIIYGSNDNIDWTEIKTFTNSVTTSGGEWTIDLSSNTGYYKYYKLFVSTSGGGSSYYGSIAEIDLTATQRVGIESTSSDYDFYIDTYKYKVYEKNGTYKAFNV